MLKNKEGMKKEKEGIYFRCYVGGLRSRACKKTASSGLRKIHKASFLYYYFFNIRKIKTPQHYNEEYHLPSQS